MRSPALGVYLFLSHRLAGAPVRHWLARRAARGKEDTERLPERFGIASLPRPQAPLVWLHAASVGESLSILELLRRLEASRPDLRFLVTSGTRTSAGVMANRLPAHAIHQYAPVDLVAAQRRFLAHWRPHLAIWIESELWPAMIHETARRGIPLILLNARMSDRSYRAWRWAPLMSRRLLGRFAAVLAQDEESAARMKRLGADPVVVTGTLKEGSSPLPHVEAERQRMAGLIGDRPLWLAASTHEGEEEIVSLAHAVLRRRSPRALLILVPRHPERGAAVADALRGEGWRVARRVAEEPLRYDTAIYVADTLGEMGLWYRLAGVSFLGGSLVPVGGHNPYEPAALGSAILHGAHVENFADGYARLAAVRASRLVTDAESLAAEVLTAMAPEESALRAAAAWEVFSEGADVTDRVLELLQPHLPPPLPPPQ
ncbi:MAG: 3-deoxy-D-manno-octulosonic acid transferase [Alphaproteobacteria bacterium]|nr:MAG: 3-deoxy-D-manno-octulosonic acid transferase [Alphaproteobacteria bacterium]